ncbi:MAG TPA: hypothetical protein VMY39_01385 [Planctomycetota bacterium]|nr:hypothetical protein [Planctomycetota bacterium]
MTGDPVGGFISFSCESCHTKYRVSVSAAGKQAKCRRCGVALTVPRREETFVPLAAPPAPEPSPQPSPSLRTPIAVAPWWRSRRILLIAGALVVVAAVAGVLVPWWRSAPGEPHSADIPGPPLAKAPAPGPAPPLPVMPTDLAWDESDTATVNKVLAEYEKNPVSACLTLSGFLERAGDKAVTDRQKTWLEQAVKTCRPHAVAVVRHDLREAAADWDLRGSLMLAAVGSKLTKEGWEEEAAALARVKNHVVSGGRSRNAVWKVTNASAERLGESYSEGFGTSQTTLTPKQGFELLRVKASVENISTGPDLPYVPWCLGDFKRVFAAGLGDDDTPANGRLVVDEMIFLLTAGGDWISCGYVCSGCDKLRDFSLTLTGKDGGVTHIFLGTMVKPGEKFDLDVIFSVPSGTDGLRLLMLGSEPVDLAIEK